ncbi:MAG: phosphate signaling complex protein PhoU [Mycobacterium sp.]
MRAAYQDQLSALTTDVANMCGMVGAGMKRATHALLQADLVMAEEAITDLYQVVLMSVDAEESGFVVLTRNPPPTGDLRGLVASIRNVADVDRMSRLAMHVAKLARRRHPLHTLPEEVNANFAEMGRVAVELSEAAQEALRSGDPGRAARMQDEDDAMDELHRHLFTVLMDRQWTHGVTAAVDVTLLSRYYERFADHAVELARRVTVQAIGQPPKEDETPTLR